MTEPLQLTFNVDAACRALLADRLRDRRRIPADGPSRLLRALILRGLAEDAVPRAVALVLELDTSPATTLREVS